MTSYERFEKLCSMKSVTAYRVSKDTGINSATFTSWKQGVYTPKVDTMQKIADYFNVSLSYLMSGEEEEKKPLPEYDPDFIKVIDMYSKLKPDQKEIIKNLMKSMI